jgi:two-component system OmpR family response regulator
MNSLPHILVVDDHRQIRDSVTRFLERNGMRATAAKDARDMDEKLGKGHFDLMVLDVMMPGEDGLSICKRLSAEKRLPIIMLTAHGREVEREKGLALGADDYITKPFSTQALVEKVKTLLAEVS